MHKPATEEKAVKIQENLMVWDSISLRIKLEKKDALHGTIDIWNKARNGFDCKQRKY